MVSKGGVALRGVTTFLRAVEFLGSALVLGITSYWLGVLTHRHDALPTWMKAVEGMSGGATLYAAFAVILTCFIGGLTFFAFLAVLLDILFVGAFVAIAVLTRHGIHSCSGSSPPSPLGPGNRTSCRLETAVFAVAIAMALLFLISAVLQIMLSRHHKKEKRYGPGPSNGYTSGTSKKQPFWKRKRGPKTTHEANEMGTFDTNGVGATHGTSAPKKQPFWKRNKNTTRDAELGAGGVGAGALIAEEKHRHDNRKSHETGVTGTTAHSPIGAAYGGNHNKYEETTVPHTNDHGHHTNVGPDINGVNNTYQPYREGAGIAEAGHQPHTQVIHDPNPYTEVHHGGFPHQAAPAEYPSTTFGHGNYQST
ncbi:MAG: hypothetical protein L6R40_006328 [Gallowayella cf. fulva]|nr:MAG: hypothetical protein L6R40_006328 [Xanthomendoza cf. fulva]